MPEVDATWDPSSKTGLTIRSLLLGRALRIRSITADEQPTGLDAREMEELGFPEDPGFGLEYELVPAGDPPPPEDAQPEVLAAWSDRNQWWLTGRDDLGTEYEVPSGAFGPSWDGAAIQGVLDIYPTPPPDGQWIDFTFHGDGYAHDYADDAGRRFVLRVTLPLPVVSLEESLNELGTSQAQLLSAMKAAQRLAETHKNAQSSEDRGSVRWDADDPGSSGSS